MTNDSINKIKEQKTKDEIILNLKKNNKITNIKEMTKLNYELGEEYFIKTKTNK